MRNIRTELDIDAPIEEVWSVLSDIENWESWNPVVPKIQARKQLGGGVRFEIHVPPGKPLKLAAKFLAWEENREMAWGGGIPGVFSGNHYFRLEPRDAGGCRIIHGEDFRGLVPLLLFTRKRVANIEAAYSRMNEALAAETKRRLAAASATPAS